MTAGAWLRATVGGYRLIEFIGAGGMGEVYRAIQLRTGNTVAVKVLTSAGRVPRLVERFRNEARIQASLQHPNIAALQEFLEHDGMPCIVMAFVDGETLEHRIGRRGALPESEALSLAAAVVEAVEYLHQRGILHRDIKASNVKVSSAGVVTLLDFGIAKGPGSPALTTLGGVIGTLSSLAPEQLGGAPATRQTDIWSIGVLLYELATGRHPFAGDNYDDVSARIRAARFPPASGLKADLSAGMKRMIDRCLRSKPKERYPSCTALLLEMRAMLQPAPVAAASPARRTLRVAAGSRVPLALGVAGALAALLFLISVLSNGPDAAAPPAPTPRPASTPVVAAGDPRQVMINTVAGVAEVWREGRVVGKTPYRVSAPIGEHVSLTLRRAGFEDEAVSFDVTEGRTEYSVVMRPLTGRRGGGGPPPPPPEGRFFPALAWFSLPWRRRTAAPQGPPTLDRPPLPDRGLAAESRIIVGVATDPGCVRESNQDAVRVVRPEDETVSGKGLLAAVLDGMGGHAAGEVASRIAGDELASHYGDHAEDPGESLARAVRGANTAVFTAAREDPALAGMGTTCTALVVRDGLAWCAHVGDSRCYLVRGAEIFLMTEDHSAVMAMVRSGALSRDEARSHPDKNVISRAVGSHREVEVTVWPQPFMVLPGDRFILCSDGLYDLAAEEEIRTMVRELPPHEACERLVLLARERGAPDNVSVVVLAMPEPRRARAPRSTRDLPAVSG